MNELPSAIKKAVNTYQPIEIDGLTLYPIRVDDYEDFVIARNALSFVQQSLPIQLMNMPILQAFFKLDMRVIDGEEPTGLFSCCLLFLALALRLAPGEDIFGAVEKFSIVTDPSDTTKLKCVRFTLNGEEEYSITPVQFSRLRPILAAQNGIELEDTDANPELLQAERDIAEKNAVNLDIKIENMISGVATVCKVEEEEIYDWPIKKLLDRSESIKRILDFVVCGIGETQGTKWKGGNPHPSPWFDKERDGSSSAVIPIEKFQEGQGLQAIRDSGALQEEN